MTLHRAAPGPQLSTGRLRVDAARAIAKLREYRLAIRAAWVLEAIRAAVASGATRISLGGDTNDLWLSWDGEPWAAADLPRLFDELVGPEATDDRYHVRLLAAAVNSALGMDPAYVDVYAIAATGGAVRARYTPDVLDEPDTELGEAPLRRIALEPAAPPAGAGPGMAIHLRRRFGFAVISHLVRELPELELARAACADLAVPLLVRGVEHGRRVQRRDVVRVPLGEDLRGFLAVVDPDTAEGRAALEVAEHGVVLSTSAIELGFSASGKPVPLRVFVDAPRMPTNASRSEVRQDVHPVSSALRRARALLAELAAQLAGALAGGPEPERARAAALALVAAVGIDEVPGLGFGRLLDLPLLRDAVGAPRTLRAGWSAIVHTGASPFPEELAPWLSEVLWIPPGDPGACLVDPATVDTQGLKRQVRWARREHRAQRRFYGHTPRPPTVEARKLPRIRARLGAQVAGSFVGQPGFEGMDGEVCIRAGGKDGELVLLLAGRELERMTYRSPIPFDAVIESKLLVPADRYRSAARDVEYARVEAAMRGGVVRAIEAIAAGHAGDGFVHGEAAPEAADRRLVLDGLSLAVELAGGQGGRVSGPLIDAKVWKLAGGGAASTVELRGYGVVGTAAPGAVQRSLAKRPIVELQPRDETLFEALLPAVRRVPYGGGESARGLAPADPIDLARELLEGAGAALAVRGDGCVGAIAAVAAVTGGATGVVVAADSQSRVVISHAGRIVEELPYTPSLIACEIHVDGDEVVPDAGWTRVLDDGGAAGHFAAWELELVRAAAASLAGARPDELLGFAPVELGDALGRALCAALAGADREPAELLGAELAERLVKQPLLHALGGAEPVSARELATRFPGPIPYVDAYAAPVPGYTPLVGDPVLARAVGRLVGREVRDARPYIEGRLRVAAREAKLAQHRLLPAAPLELPDNAPHVVREAGKLRAIVGVGRGEGMELHVRVEGRPFAVVRRAGKLPLIAAVEVPLQQVDDDFAAVRIWAVEAIVREVRAAVPALLRAIAEARPAALAELGPIRTLLAAALEDMVFDNARRAALVAAEAFPTLQGPRISIARAVAADLVSIASWDGEWLGPEPGEAPDALDLPVLHVPAGADELSAIIERLHHRVIDVTDAADRLQAQRRMKRGLLPPPAVHGVAPELKRRLAEVGEAGREIGFDVGVGEIGLVDEPASTALLHVRGVLRDRLAIDVLPSVHLAIEAPELVGGLTRGGAVDLDVIDSVEQLRHLSDHRPSRPAIGPDAQRIAARLVAAIVREQPVLPAWVRHRLRKALLAGRLATEVDGAPLFETVTGEWLDRAALGRQIEVVGDVWCVARPPADPQPLDERRVVLKLSGEEQELARGRGLPFVDATQELELDALARTNRARPPAASLAIDPGISVLAAIPLEGDGVTTPRGVVAVLAPNAAAHRGVRAHRELHPFDYSADPCSWPTLAIVDDARLAPDRTWSRPVRDEAWNALVTAIRNASDAALRELVRRPRSLVAQAIGAASHAGLSALRRDSYTQIRGALWLDGAPGTPGQIEIVREGGSEPFVAPREIAMSGTLYVFSPADRVRLRQAVTELCAAVHARFLRALGVRRGSSPELAAAHLAYGLALERITPADAPAVRLGCFRSRPIDAQEWVSLCKSTQRVPLVAPDAVVDELSVTDDGSPLAKVVLGVLGARVYVDRPVPRPDVKPERLAPPLRDSELAVPAPSVPPLAFSPPPRPRPVHPLDPVVAAVGERLLQLGIAAPMFAILEGIAAPMVRYEDDAICFAADHPQLQAIAAACVANTAWRAAAVDALVAHSISVLNIALTSVTDATELHLLGGLLG